MRKLFSIVLGCAIVLLSACSTNSLAYYDDIYTTSSDAQYGASAPTQTKSGPAELQPDSIVYEYDENGNLLDTKTYYPGQTTPTVTYYEVPVEESSYAVTDYDDDCYDYYYTSRLRRFHTNLYCNYGYYDPYFTNLYWYDSYPGNWGLSIYMGYNWWWPSYYYRPYYYDYGWYHYGFNYGWGWHHPYGYWDYGYHHWHGPHHYLAADYWHNHLDPNHSYYYGHRNNIGPSVGNPGRENRPEGFGLGGNNDNNNHYSITSSAPSFNQRYENIAAQYSTGGGGRGSSTVTPSAPTSRPTAPVPSKDRVSSQAVEMPSNTSIMRENQAKPTTTTVSKPVVNSRTEIPSTSRTNTATQIESNSTSRTNTTTFTNSNTSKTPTIINRTVPSQPTARPANSTGTTTTPSRTTTTPSNTQQRYNPTPSRSSATPSSSSRPASTSSTRPSYSGSSNPSPSRPATTPSSSSSSRSSYSTPSRSSYSGSSSPSRSSYSSGSSSSRSSYSGSSSSSRSSYSSGSSSHSSYSGSSSSSRSSFSGSSSSRSSSSSSSSHSSGSYGGGRR